MSRIVLLLAGLAVDDVEEQLGDEVVTLATVGNGPLWTEGIGGQGQWGRWRWDTERILGQHSLLSVAMHEQ